MEKKNKNNNDDEVKWWREKRAAKRKEYKKNENEIFEDNKSKMCSCSFVAINMKSLSAELYHIYKKNSLTFYALISQ
jgi:hypothetical protein